jgi:nitrous oxide reductase accessory protein NosL
MQKTILFFAVIILFPGIVCSQTVSVPQGAKCAECGMSIDPESKFISEVTIAGDKKLLFCDVGDMLIHFRSSKEKAKDVHVRDYATGAWIDGKKALYIFNRRISTPMSWSIAAFREESAAKQWGNPVDFDRAFTLLK